VNLSDARMSTYVTISGRPDVLRQLKVSWNIPYTVNILTAITTVHCQAHITAELEVTWTCSWCHNSTNYSWFSCIHPCVDFLWTFVVYILQFRVTVFIERWNKTRYVYHQLNLHLRAHWQADSYLRPIVHLLH
jgi:hypothetical protein